MAPEIIGEVAIDEDTLSARVSGEEALLLSGFILGVCVVFGVDGALGAVTLMSFVEALRLSM